MGAETLGMLQSQNAEGLHDILVFTFFVSNIGGLCFEQF
jgi:hypothetical protein